MTRALVAIALAGLLSGTAACGSGDAATTEDPTAMQSTQLVESSAEEPTVELTPEYAIRNADGLRDALLTIQDMPIGYSQDPEEDVEGNKNFCDYKAPFEEKVRVTRDFTKGGGLSSEMVSVTLRQYKNIEQAQAAFDALAKTMETCTGETYEGTKLEYAAMSAPKVGDGSIGIRVQADNFTLLQNFALVGPTLVSAGGGGMMNANADQVATLLESQVAKYRDAATR